MKSVAWKKISQFEGPEESPGFVLWKVSTQWRRQIETALLPLGLTHPQFVLLASLGWLTREKADVTQVDLARHCKTDINMTSQVLRTLERKGFIERFHHKEDERAKLSRITEKGARLIEQAIQVVEKVDRDFFAEIKPESTTWIDILQTLVR